MDDSQFKRLLEFFSRSWKGYRKARRGVKKRISRHMQAVGCRRVETYLQHLRRNDAARSACEKLLTVSISRFYRDRRVWELLSTPILPALSGQGVDLIRVWSAGCARGEEVYSLKILWAELRRRGAPVSRLAVTATDINTTYLEAAKTGIYTRGSVKELSPALKSRYFEMTRGGRRWSVRPELSAGIEWCQRDILAGPPSDHLYHLILLRNNLLTYYRNPEKRTGIEKILAALAPGGFLIVGAHEHLPETAGRLEPVAGSRLIYRRRSR